MHKWLYHRARSLFMKIAEPRVIRIMLFGAYLMMLVAGVGILTRPPGSFQGVLGLTLVYILGSFIFLGALFSVVAVLPGIWWLERTGILALITGMSIYAVTLIALGSSIMGISVTVAFALLFGVRWQEIKRFQLAPLAYKEG